MDSFEQRKLLHLSRGDLFCQTNQCFMFLIYFTNIVEATFALDGNSMLLYNKMADRDVLEKYRRNSTFRAKFFRREVSSSSRSLLTNSQTKGLGSKRRISLVFSTHFHSYQPSFAIIATNNLP